MKKIIMLITGICVAGALVIGCGKQSPSAPVTNQPNGTKSVKLLKPGGVLYEGKFGGWSGVKPWYWIDAQDYPSYNAAITTNGNAQSANITRVNGGTWGKVSTFAIAYSNTANANVSVRIFVPSHSVSVVWKIVVQEQGGAWRNWVLQDSTGYTGYKDYDLTAMLAAVNAGSGSFTLELITEGAVGQYIEVTELYVYVQGTPNDFWSGAYWVEYYGIDAPTGNNRHTAGWFDETTNPGFHATIENIPGHMGHIVGDATLGGKVMSPVIPWDSSQCQVLYVSTHDQYAFSVWIQEQSGQYRQWQIPKTWNGQGYTCDLQGLVPLANGAPFSVTISDVFGSMYTFPIVVRKALN